MNLNDYITLGRSGLKVSPLCLGTMTFGTEWGWGNDEAASKAIFDHYLDAGGNFFDTADGYTNGRSEEWLGKFIRERKVRDRAVLATKFTFNAESGNPNTGGNGRKNIYRALEGSLQRLGTDYVDLYWMHAWDMVTPVEEVVATFDDLIREGKIRYAGFSDVPAWYAARAQTIAEKEGKHPLIALQLEYSLIERTIEREHVPAAQELGFGICPWSPLAGGFLAGKYRRENTSVEGRLSITKGSGNPVFDKFTERNWKVLDALLEVAKEAGRSPAEVALNWALNSPGITSLIIGATKIDQLKSNLSSLNVALTDAQRQKLNEAGKLENAHPYMFFGEPFQGMIHGGVPVRRWRG
ncbi:MAG: aldo/keto reductase [Methylacidiphilales bacterium]|nr:aldo/keto reductase [Candidatus Methylacidiphilales bacterium]